MHPWVTKYYTSTILKNVENHLYNLLFLSVSNHVINIPRFDIMEKFLFGGTVPDSKRRKISLSML